MKFLFFIPFIIALIMEGFRQELGLSIKTYEIIHDGMYLLSGVLILVNLKYYEGKPKTFMQIISIIVIAVGLFGILRAISM